MKRTYVIGFTVALLGLVGLAIWSRSIWGTNSGLPSSQDDHTIIINADGFLPENITVVVGTTVTFVNKDAYWHWPASDPHPSHTFYPELDPKAPIKPGTTWEFTATKSGTWGIHDHLAPYITGSIAVTP